MKLSKEGLKRLVFEEGIGLKPYYDNAANLTIGVGHLLTDKELSTETLLIGTKPIRWRDGLTRAQAFELLDQDCDVVEKCLNDNIKVPLRQNEFDALVSFVFNIGITAFKDSSFLKKLNKKAPPADLKSTFLVWRLSKKRVNPILVARRKREWAFFTS